MKDLREILGEMLKKDRMALRKSLSVFCRENDIMPSKLSRIERGRASRIDPEVFDKIGTGLGIDKTSQTWEEMKKMVDEINQIPLRELTEEEIEARMPFMPFKSDGTPMSEEELESLRETLKNA